MDIESGVWVDEEFEALDLGDPRRDRRARELLKRLAAKPTVSIPGACDGWTETMAAYRFFGNEEVKWVDMMLPHWERTAARMQQHVVVLCCVFRGKLDTHSTANRSPIPRQIGHPVQRKLDSNSASNWTV